MLLYSVTTDRDPCGLGVSVTANSVDITHGPGIESPGGLVLRLGVQDTGKASRQSQRQTKGGAGSCHDRRLRASAGATHPHLTRNKSSIGFGEALDHVTTFLTPTPTGAQ